MKSKSFDLQQSSAEKHALDKTLDFVGLYKPAAESNKVAEKRKSDDSINKDSTKTKPGTPKRERSPNKNKRKGKQEQLEISQINIDGSNLNTSLARSSPVNDSKVTSTPNTSSKTGVKSIMKNKSPMDQSTDSPRSTMSSGKPKKRNKSVSFMLEDNEEVLVKRTKSDDSTTVNKKIDKSKISVKDKRKNLKKFKMDKQSEKENKAADVNNQNMDVDSSKTSGQEKKSTKANKGKKLLDETPAASVAEDAKTQTQEKKKKLKKVKKQKPETSSEPTDTENNNNVVTTDIKTKKPKNKKSAKPQPAETPEAEGEPASKSRKKEIKADIAEDLENLSIGDNAHTLTNLLDEMTVVDKDKRKKLKHKFNKNKKPKGPQSSTKEDSEKSEEVKEKVKWKKRKWNKDKKGDADEENLSHTVLVENLPIAIMLSFRKLLTEHFLKYGPIKKIGVAEVYPTEESKPVFTTTITFQSDEAAEQMALGELFLLNRTKGEIREALQENNSYIEGSRIRVKQVLPATQTTVVVRSYAELTDQALSTVFLGAGKIRSIRHLVKGKKSMGTAFVEFDGPETVERAIKKACDSKIGGKKIHLSKFEIRVKKVKKHKNDADSAADADSEDSND